jgi:hypothetical protein
MDRQTQVILFYIVLTVALAYAGSYTQYENGAMYGGIAGVVLSVILWYAYGKKWAAEENVQPPK